MSKVVVITGHAGGIGAALAAEFLDSGFQVVGIDRVSDERFSGKEIVADLCAITVDDAQRSSFKELLLEAVHGKECIALINNAAIQKLGPLEGLSSKDCLQSIFVNSVAPLLIAQILKQNLSQSRGVIVNISSIHVDQTKVGFAAYAASKSALSAYSKSMSIEWGGEIKVLEVRPAAISTQMLEDGFNENPEARKLLDRLHPSGSIASPADIARQVKALTVTAESFLNGSIISFDGGISHCLLDPDYL